MADLFGEDKQRLDEIYKSLDRKAIYLPDFTSEAHEIPSEVFLRNIENSLSQDGFSRSNPFSEYIERETHHEIGRREFGKDPSRWSEKGMTPEKYTELRNGILRRFVQMAADTITLRWGGSPHPYYAFMRSLDPEEVSRIETFALGSIEDHKKKS